MDTSLSVHVFVGILLSVWMSCEIGWKLERLMSVPFEVVPQTFQVEFVPNFRSSSRDISAC